MKNVENKIIYTAMGILLFDLVEELNRYNKNFSFDEKNEETGEISFYDDQSSDVFMYLLEFKIEKSQITAVLTAIVTGYYEYNIYTVTKTTDSLSKLKESLLNELITIKDEVEIPYKRILYHLSKLESIHTKSKIQCPLSITMQRK